MVPAVLNIFTEVVLLCPKGLCASGTSIWVSVIRSYYVIKPPKKVGEPRPCWGEHWGVSARKNIPRNVKRQWLEDENL